MEEKPVPQPLVLVVDDDPPTRRLVRRHLEEMGLHVDEAGGGRAALAWLAERRPDLVCLDLMLPELSGYDVCEFMRSSPRLKTVPVLVVSARNMPMDRAFAREAGAAAYLTKPFGSAALRAEVATLLAAARPEEV